MQIELGKILAQTSPRLSPRPMGLTSRAIYASIFCLWVLLFLRAFEARGLLAWSAGIVYILYDSSLIFYVTWQTLGLAPRFQRPRPAAATIGLLTPVPRLTLTVVLAARNEVRGLPGTLAALIEQTDPADCIIIADDGSTDGSDELLQARYGLQMPALDGLSAVSRNLSGLYWLRLSHRGKAEALNQALLCLNTDLIVTLDADTLLAPDALSVMRQAFEQEQALVAATGVLTPVCAKTLSGRVLQSFQTYEYIRNFISRFAWMRTDSLLLVSGAFAGFRRQALLTVGGFDPACLVEDYEVIHRLHRHAIDHDLGWSVRVLGHARALTDAPSTLSGFLRQRQRWFAGFLQTQYWNRDMTGNRHYGRLGTLMLPVKAIDTLQPLYGLTAFALLIVFLFDRHSPLVVPIFSLVGAKIVLDLVFHFWSIVLYRRWTGDHQAGNFAVALLAVLAEPFSFQLLRHLGASWGWLMFLSRRRYWSEAKRSGIVRLG